MKLYYSQGACSLAPHVILEELGIPYTAQQMVGDNGDFERPDFLKINPMGYIPVLELSNGEHLIEGVAIQTYLADLKPELNLIPRFGTFERAKLNEWMTLLSTEIHKGYGAIFGAQAYVQSPAATEEFKTNARQILGKKLDIVEKKLANKKFVLGDAYSIADIYLFTLFSWTPYVGMKSETWPTLVAHSKRVAERPAVHRVLVAEDLLD